jgi:hypothetical protein
MEHPTSPGPGLTRFAKGDENTSDPADGIFGEGITWHEPSCCDGTDDSVNPSAPASEPMATVASANGNPDYDMTAVACRAVHDGT